MNTLLRKKIVYGYSIVLLLLIIAIVIVTEYHYHDKSKCTIVEINRIRENINRTHMSIIKLATLGEAVVIGGEFDYNIYYRQSLITDSILLKIKSDDVYFSNSSQIDSIRELLETKRNCLFRIIKVFRSLEETDSLFTNKLPSIIKQNVKIKEIRRNKKGLSGLLGNKETVHVLHYTDEIQDFTNRVDSVMNFQNNQVRIYVDSLQILNNSLNNKLYELSSLLDNQMQYLFAKRNLDSLEIRKKSFLFFVIIMIVLVIILIISFIIIRLELCKEERIKLQLKRTVKENKSLLEMQKKIILTVSHDIRGPLGNIHNCVDLAFETSNKKKRYVYLEDIKHSCEHMLHLVNNLMDAYRINEACDLRNDIPFHLYQFLRRISDEFSRKANIKTLIFYSEHENSSLIVKGDADRLEQILNNLLTNAIKFTPFGSIDFHSKYLDGKLLIEIKDTGIGMDEETQKRVFSPFERAAQNVNSEGFGLGLFLTKGLVKILDGTIEVESKLGEGSIFRLEFPLPETDELLEEDKSDLNKIAILPKNVLIVDDDKIQLKIAEDMLERKGISCTTCMNAKDVVIALGDSDYDMILTDVQMPDIDGFALLKLLRNSDIGNSKTIPVAVMTARGDSNTGIYEKEGFAGCIHKPFNIHALLTFLSTIMSQIRVLQTRNFDFSCLLDNIDDNGHMLSLVIIESEKEIEELRTAIKTSNRESMSKMIHRMIPVWEMFGKEYLLHDFQEHLHDTDSSDETICKHAIQIVEWIEKLIEEAKNELSKHENTDR